MSYYVNCQIHRALFPESIQHRCEQPMNRCLAVIIETLPCRRIDWCIYFTMAGWPFSTNMSRVGFCQMFRPSRQCQIWCNACRNQRAFRYVETGGLLYLLYFTLLYFTLLYFTLLYFTLVELFCHQRRVDTQSGVSPSPSCWHRSSGFPSHCTISVHHLL